MKNLKLFVFALCAVLLSVVTVNAAQPACNLPGETDSRLSACQASVDGVGFDTVSHAWTEVTSNGGTLKLLGTNNISLGGDTITKNITIDAGGNTVYVTNLTVAANASLTVQNGTYSSTGTITNNGTLTFSNVVATSSATLVNNNGTAYVNGGKVTVTGADGFANSGTLTFTNVTEVSAGYYLVAVNNNSKTVINGGTYKATALFKAPTSDPKPATTMLDKADAAASVEVKAGTIVTTVGSNVDHEMNVTFDNANYEVTSKSDALTLTKGNLTVNGGVIYADADDAVVVDSTATEAALNITGGKVVSAKGGYALALNSTKATYAISGGTFESSDSNAFAAIWLANGMVTKVDGKVTVNKAISGILTGGLYLNKVIAKVSVNGGSYEVSDQLVAEGYTIKDTKKDNKDYKEVVSTKAPAETTKPGAPGKEEAPNTFDAGLVYMGLALSAIGASVVSVRKLRNN